MFEPISIYAIFIYLIFRKLGPLNRTNSPNDTLTDFMYLTKLVIPCSTKKLCQIRESYNEKNTSDHILIETQV